MNETGFQLILNAFTFNIQTYPWVNNGKTL